jgi:hypothetical protein
VIIWVSLCLPFFPSASPATTYIFIAPTCTTTIIGLEPYALNVEFQHSIHRFNKFFSLYGYTERGVWKWKEAQRQGDFIINLNICTYTYMPQNTYTGHVSVFDKYLHWPHVNIFKIIYMPTM